LCLQKPSQRPVKTDFGWELGEVCNKTTIEVVPYDASWPEMFKEEERVIREALKGDELFAEPSESACNAVYHIGSTSVPQLSAKPIIDIIAVAKHRANAIASLERIGYVHQGEWNIPLKCGFTKRDGTSVNLHVFFEEDHPEIELNIKFRDYLRAHQEARAEYAALKMKILQEGNAEQRVGRLGFPLYTLKKRDFICDVLKKTGFNRLRVLKCIADAEWEVVKDFRRKHFERLGTADPYDDLDTSEFEHFLLYRGVEIIGYAHIMLGPSTSASLDASSVVPVGEQEARVCIFKNTQPECDDYFRGVIVKWANEHKYENLWT
jgi:GrpB-like predicted nucleotidyltransferase (UPF0157 family)